MFHNIIRSVKVVVSSNVFTFPYLSIYKLPFFQTENLSNSSPLVVILNYDQSCP